MKCGDVMFCNIWLILLKMYIFDVVTFVVFPDSMATIVKETKFFELFVQLINSNYL